MVWISNPARPSCWMSWRGECITSRTIRSTISRTSSRHQSTSERNTISFRLRRRPNAGRVPFGPVRRFTGKVPIHLCSRRFLGSAPSRRESIRRVSVQVYHNLLLSLDCFRPRFARGKTPPPWSEVPDVDRASSPPWISS